MYFITTGRAVAGLAPQTDIAHCTDTIITSQSVSQSVSQSGLPGMSNNILLGPTALAQKKMSLSFLFCLPAVVN